jgi:hypothetical protein
MIEPYLIDILREEEQKKQAEAGIPLHIYPPGFDGYRYGPHEPDDTGRKDRGYVEVNYEVGSGENEGCLIIDM